MVIVIVSVAVAIVVVVVVVVVTAAIKQVIRPSRSRHISTR
jgi:hypothetical protein